MVELDDASDALRKIAEDRPSLSEPATVLMEILPILFANEPVAQLEIPESVALDKLQNNLPIVRGETLQFERSEFQRRWCAICDAVQRHQGLPDATELSEALRNGNLSSDLLVRHALAGDTTALAALAESRGLSVELTLSVLRLTLFPVMSHIGDSLSLVLAKHRWNRGHCPVCASWPLLAELRGLEQSCYLRCGLCATAWEFSRLQCPFCEVCDHRQLSYFHVEGEEAKLRVVNCGSCRGYVKTVSTLSALDAASLLVTDLGTIHLDLAAAERGYLVPTLAKD